MSENREGTVVTFYSYKGGTGRTMALANVAWILAANGYRVLAVDWDLEAPGLHRFFHPFLDLATLEATPGLINLITEYQEEVRRPGRRAPNWHRDYARVRPHATSVDWAFQQGGSLDFLSAGRSNRDYSAAVSRMDWDDFYVRYGGGQFFDAMRADMQRHYDYTLIDSRTGFERHRRHLHGPDAPGARRLLHAQRPEHRRSLGGRPADRGTLQGQAHPYSPRADAHRRR